MILACLSSGLSGLQANAAGYFVGLLLSFTLNRYYVFGRRGAVSEGEIARFLVAFFIAYMTNVSVLLATESVLGASRVLAQVPAMAVYSLVFFVLSQTLVFNHRDSE